MKKNATSQANAHPRKSIEKSRMRDRRRVVAADQIEHEVKRRDDQHAPNRGDSKDDLSESHAADCITPGHSYRSATIGSTRLALRAGKEHATSAIATKNRDTAANVSGSAACTPYFQNENATCKSMRRFAPADEKGPVARAFA